MFKRFCAFVCSFALVASFAWAQDGSSTESTQEYYAPQSDIVSVLNDTDGNGNYIAEWKDGNVQLKFKFDYPELGADTTLKYLGIYRWPNGEGIDSATVYKNTVEGFSPLNHEKPSTANSYMKLASSISISGSVCPSKVLNYLKDGLGDPVYYYVFTFDEEKKSCDLVVTLPYLGRGGVATYFAGDTITFPINKLCAFYLKPGEKKPSVARKYTSATYKFVVREDENHVLVRNSVKSSELTSVGEDTYLYLSNPAVLSVDNDFSCKNIFVRSGDESSNGLAAGIVVAEGASLTADSVYYLPNLYDDRAIAYLVNNGSYNAGSAFSKGVDNEIPVGDKYARKYGYMDPIISSVATKPLTHEKWYFSVKSFSNPIEVVSTPNYIDITWRVSWIAGRKSSGIIAPYLVKSTLFSMYYDWVSLKNNVLPAQPLYILHKHENLDEHFRVRVAGAINDNPSYELDIEDVNPDGSYDEEQVKTFINNPYQAPVDWRSIATSAGDQFVDDVKDVHISNVVNGIYSMYNMKTGFTTFDAPGKMYYGYLQPQMSHVQLVHQNGNQSSVTISKSDVCSYAMADEKYGNSDIVDYPYVRLFVDETDETVEKGEGLRSVVALYFVPEDKYDELHNADLAGDALDADYGVNTVWETLAETCYKADFYGSGYVFPYLGAYQPGQQKSDKAAVIKMVKMPTTVSEQYKGYGDVLSDFIRVSVDTNMVKGAIKLGVLDYNFGDSNLAISLGDIALNYPGKADRLSMLIDVKEGYVESQPFSIESTNRTFEGDKLYDRWPCKQLSLNLNIAQVDRTADSKVSAPDASKIKAANGQVSVSSSVSGTLSVYDLAGRLIAERFAEGSVSVSVPDGVYVATYSSANSTVRSRVVVK